MRRSGAAAQGRSGIKGRAARCLTTFVVIVIFCASASLRLSAQLSVHAQAIPLVTRAWQMPDGGRTLTEFTVVQPAVMFDWSRAAGHGSRLFFRATFNGEGVTVPDGELAPGDHGEGYYDRRHPHTYVHELIAGGRVCLPRAAGCGPSASLVAGKGFVAFGTDDPMSRPVVRYPVNHHLAQILERAVVIGSLEWRGVALEATWFNGDEPTHPSDRPNSDRYFDSHALRLSARPWRGVELQASTATVKSPEHRPGAGPTAEKRSVSVRYARPDLATAPYVLAEWARTEDAGGFFVYRSWLAEGAAALGRHRPYLRLERTERPEEQRLPDPFRSVRPHTDDGILGITRWTVVTAGTGVSFLTARGRLEWRPFVEGALAHVEATRGIFDPETFYGADVLPSVTVGVRVDWGRMSRMRMGNYLATGTSAHNGMHP